MEDPAPSWAARVVAANLTTAAQVFMLSAQLRGEAISLAEAMASVRAVWEGLALELDGGEAWHSAASTIVDISLPSSPETMLVAGPDTERVAGGTATTAGDPDTEPLGRAGTATITARRNGNPGLLDGRYALREKIAEGDAGDVFLAEQVATNQLVAIKFYDRWPGSPDRAAQSLRREAATLARLNHPGIPQVYDVGTSERGLFVAMEYVRGETMRAALARSGPPPLGEGLRLLREVAAAVGAAHEGGVVHRDLKPEKVVLVFEGAGPSRPRVLGFCVAPVDDRDADPNVTDAGADVGTPAYMAPEQASERRVSPASDVYSLGVVAYELLTGVNPFADETPADTAMRHAKLEPPPPSRVRGEIPPSVDAAVLRALAKRPEERFATAAEFARAL